MSARRRSRAALALGLLLALAGCAPKQPRTPLLTARDVFGSDRALLYLYRPIGETSDQDRAYSLAVNGRVVIDLPHGSYFAYETAPGTLQLGARPHRPGSSAPATLELRVEAGEIYFVRLHPQRSAVGVTPRLERVSRAEAEKEIAGCIEMGKDR